MVRRKIRTTALATASLTESTVKIRARESAAVLRRAASILRLTSGSRRLERRRLGSERKKLVRKS
jgi:hypothetical protein